MKKVFMLAAFAMASISGVAAKNGLETTTLKPIKVSELPIPKPNVLFCANISFVFCNSAGQHFSYHGNLCRESEAGLYSFVDEQSAKCDQFDDHE